MSCFLAVVGNGSTPTSLDPRWCQGGSGSISLGQFGSGTEPGSVSRDQVTKNCNILIEMGARGGATVQIFYGFSYKN